MAKFCSKQVSAVRLEGRFLGFESEDGDRKYLRLATSSGEAIVKLAKYLRSSELGLITGDWVQIVGEKLEGKTGKIKLKAERVIVSSINEAAIGVLAKKPEKTKANILVCQKSDCMKRGGKGVCQALAAALSDRSLEGEVAIKGTGCMKNCKAGPNVIMPDKTRYTRIQADKIPEIVDKHFPAESGNASKPITVK